MMKITAVASAVLILMGIGMAGAEETLPIVKAAEGQTVKKQTFYPVMGGKVNTNLCVDANGKRVYLRCMGYVKAVKADTEKSIKKLEAGGVVLDKTPQAATTNYLSANSPQKEVGTTEDR